MVVLAVLMKGGYTGNTAVKIQASRAESFKLPPIQEWLPIGNSTEPIFKIFSAFRTMRPLFEPLNRQSDTVAMQELEDAITAKLFKYPHTKWDYADIMSAARKFGRVYGDARRDHIVAHDVRALQVFATWMMFVIDAFDDVNWTGTYDAYASVAKEMNDEYEIVLDYVRQTKRGTAKEKGYPVIWKGLDLVFRDLIEVLDPPRVSQK